MLGSESLDTSRPNINVNSVNEGGGNKDNTFDTEVRVYSFNVQSICNKFLEFKESMYCYKPKIVGVCESWLHDGVPEGD